MFEFHGWASIRYHTHDTSSVLQDECWSRVEQRVAQVPTELIRLQRYNGCDSVHAHGMHNHRADYVIDLFRWVAANAPGSYGLLFVSDDEDTKRVSDFSNCFRVWCLRRGELLEMDDPFLSPTIPMIEDPYDPSRGD